MPTRNAGIRLNDVAIGVTADGERAVGCDCPPVAQGIRLVARVLDEAGTAFAPDGSIRIVALAIWDGERRLIGQLAHEALVQMAERHEVEVRGCEHNQHIFATHSRLLLAPNEQRVHLVRDAIETQLHTPVLALMLQPALHVGPQGTAEVNDKVPDSAIGAIAEIGAQQPRRIVEHLRVSLVAGTEVLHIASRVDESRQHRRSALPDGGIVMVDVVAVRPKVGIEDLVVHPAARERSDMLGKIVQRRVPSPILARHVE